jgi:hypothetical protein
MVFFLSHARCLGPKFWLRRINAIHVQRNMDGHFIQGMGGLQGCDRQEDRSSYMTATAKRNPVTSNANPMMERANVK